jgi:GR25 family glycosyltransferase involved in LPS biosynthesis
MFAAMTSLLRIFAVCNLSLLGDTLSFQRVFDLGEVSRMAEAETLSQDCALADMPFFVLNLDRRRKDKFGAMEHVIEREAPWMCEKTCRVSAPDGQTWGPHLNNRIMGDKAWQKVRNISQYDTVVAHKLTQGAVALIAGHGRMWEHVLQAKAKFAVVMEDDLVRFHPNLKTFLCWITHYPGMQDGWDFMLLQSASQPVVPRTLTYTKEGHVYNTGMYIIKLEAARKALQTMFPITHPVQLDSPDSFFWTKLRGAHTRPGAADASHDITDVQQYTLMPSTCSIQDCKPLDPKGMVVPELASPTK